MSRTPETINCETCKGERTVYFNRAGSTLAVGVPVACQTRHECRRETRAQFPYSALRTSIEMQREQLGGPSPLALALKRITPLPEAYFSGVAERMCPPILSDVEKESIETRHLLNSIYRNIVRGRAHTHWLENFYNTPLCATWNPERDIVADFWRGVDNLLPKRGAAVTSELIYKLQDEETT